jgi:hypothetical protein
MVQEIIEEMWSAHCIPQPLLAFKTGKTVAIQIPHERPIPYFGQISSLTGTEPMPHSWYMIEAVCLKPHGYRAGTNLFL